MAQQVVSDDLTVIKGIGPAIQEKLRALGIATFSDLARADPKAWGLKGPQPISEARVRGWIEAARQRTVDRHARMLVDVHPRFPGQLFRSRNHSFNPKPRMNNMASSRGGLQLSPSSARSGLRARP